VYKEIGGSGFVAFFRICPKITPGQQKKALRGTGENNENNTVVGISRDDTLDDSD
jgi:hypothetical protein